MKLQDLLKAGIVHAIDDAGGGEDHDELSEEEIAEQERQAEIDRLANERAQEIAKTQAEKIASDRIAAERAKWEAEKSGATEEIKDPYAKAEAEFAAKGEDWNKEGIARRAMAIQQELTDKRLSEIERRTHDRLMQTEVKDTVAQLVGDDPIAQDYAKKYVLGGADLSNPDVRDLIVRGARDAAREKASTRTSVTVEKSDTIAKPVLAGVRAQADALAIGDIRLTDEEIKEVMREAGAL